MTAQRIPVLVISIVLAVMPALVLAQPSMGTAITYQGQLRYGGAPVNDTADFEFSLWDDPNSVDPNDQVGSVVPVNNVDVVRGLFTVLIDFGANAFTGEARWLEIAVRSPAGGGSFTTLSPRQELTPTPYALLSLGNWSATGNSGTDPNSHFLGTSDTKPLVVKTGGAEVVRIDTVGNVGIGTSSPESPLHIAGGNANLEATEGDFKIGDQTRRLKMGVQLAGPGNGNAYIRVQGGVERLRLGAGTTDVLTIKDTGVGIFETNPAAALDVAGTVKTSGFQLTTTPQDGYVLTSSASGTGTWQPAPAGGDAWSLTGNAGTDPNSHFLGTTDNVPLELRVNGERVLRIEPDPNGPGSSFAVGRRAEADHAGTFVWADSTDEDFTSTSANQFRVRATGGVDLVVDLDPNYGGGLRVLPTEPEPYGHGGPNIIAGYSGNTVADGVVGATISGGGTVMYHPSGGGDFPGLQTVSSCFGTIGGGIANAVADDPNDPNALAWCATVGGGLFNVASDFSATVAGGMGNRASGRCSSIGGGFVNRASGRYATIPGGEENIAAGKYSFAAGQRAKANHDGAFLFADSSGWGDFLDFDSVAADEFAVRCTGGARFVSAIDGSGNPTAGVQLASGGTSWSAICDRNLKENFTPVDGQDVLACLAEVPITTWNAKAQDPSIRHMGPVAQDFHAAFGLGEDDKHITTVDADGVALAAIQGLYEIVQEKDAEIEALRAEKDAEISALNERLSHMEALLSRVVRQHKEDT